MGLARQFAEQHGRPHGPLGRLAAWSMVARTRKANTWVVDLLHVQPGDHVLELGFGPGLALHDTAARLTSGHIVGIDPASTMVDMAHSHNLRNIRAGRVRLVQGLGEALPFASATFDRTLTINVIYFLPDPLVVLREVARVLRPGGQLAIFWMPAATLARQGRAIAEVYRFYEPVEVIELLLAAGFEGPWIRTSYFTWGGGLCAQATKPGGQP